MPSGGDRWRAARARRRLRAARYWYSIGDLDEAVRAGRQAWRRVGPGRGSARSVLLRAEIGLTLARIEHDRDDYTAAAARLAAALTALEPLAGSPCRDRLLARTLVAIGGSQRRAGRYPEAIETLDRALHQAEGLPGDRSSVLAAALTERAITAKEIGDYDRSGDLYAVVQQIHQDVGADPGDAATLEHNRAGLEYSRGCFAVAELHARRAVDRRRRAPGALGVEIAADLAVLAAAVAAQHRYEEARVWFEQALSVGRAARPPRRYEIAVHLHGLADIEHSAGRPESAERRYREALAIKQELLGPDHPEVGLVLGNLGVLLQEQRREPEAGECYRRALDIAEQTFGCEHPRSARLRARLHRLSPAGVVETG